MLLESPIRKSKESKKELEGIWEEKEKKLKGGIKRGYDHVRLSNLIIQTCRRKGHQLRWLKPSEEVPERPEKGSLESANKEGSLLRENSGEKTSMSMFKKKTRKTDGRGIGKEKRGQMTETNVTKSCLCQSPKDLPKQKGEVTFDQEKRRVTRKVGTKEAYDQQTPEVVTSGTSTCPQKGCCEKEKNQTSLGAT